jgi:hypothetical protein
VCSVSPHDAEKLLSLRLPSHPAPPSPSLDGPFGDHPARLPISIGGAFMSLSMNSSYCCRVSPRFANSASVAWRREADERAEPDCFSLTGGSAPLPPRGASAPSSPRNIESRGDSAP